MYSSVFSWGRNDMTESSSLRSFHFGFIWYVPLTFCQGIPYLFFVIANKMTKIGVAY